mmetsp:Transcript_41335/g.118462  ORF Transcript_41335/g.118462 Transcript_41335/m.118462 type:complete len:205 (+) Transcript_41335:1127-1741(+)
MKMVGRVKDKHETNNMVTLTIALLETNTCCFSVTSLKYESALPRSGSAAFSVKLTFALTPSPISTMPPKRNDMPRTRSMLDSTDPRSVSLTSDVSPALRVCTVMITSTAFPKVALSRPLTTSLCRQASSSSVASPRIFASGIRAQKFNQKVAFGPQSKHAESMPRGNATERMLKGWIRMDCIPAMFLLTYDTGALLLRLPGSEI